MNREEIISNYFWWPSHVRDSGLRVARRSDGSLVRVIKGKQLPYAVMNETVTPKIELNLDFWANGESQHIENVNFTNRSDSTIDFYHNPMWPTTWGTGGPIQDLFISIRIGGYLLDCWDCGPAILETAQYLSQSLQTIKLIIHARRINIQSQCFDWGKLSGLSAPKDITLTGKRKVQFSVIHAHGTKNIVYTMFCPPDNMDARLRYYDIHGLKPMLLDWVRYKGQMR